MSETSLNPRFSTLSRAEIDALLARHHVARLAYSRRDRVDIEPIHYVYVDGWIYARTQPGTKLSTVIHNPWVALEVDEVRAMYDWESAVVRGRLELLDDGPHETARTRYRTAVDALRGLVPEALMAHDPTPARTIICAIYVDEVEGRRAQTAT
jgi:nitroimidazol reductase NimA-like FMN-containing flavoprotein (pyridoxamine 5'-phosphate oxidase superfamily)